MFPVVRPNGPPLWVASIVYPGLQQGQHNPPVVLTPVYGFLSSAPLLDQQRCPHQRISVMSVFLYIVYLAHIFVLSGRSGPLGFIAPKREGGEGGYRIEGFIKMVPPRLLLLLLLFILHFECSCNGWWM